MSGRRLRYQLPPKPREYLAVSSKFTDHSYSFSNSDQFVEIISEVTRGETVTVEEVIPHWRSANGVTALVEIFDQTTVYQWCEDNERDHFDVKDIEFPVYLATYGNSSDANVYLISKRSYLNLTQPMHQLTELVHLLKFSPLFGCDVEVVKEHFENEIKKT